MRNSLACRRTWAVVILVCAAGAVAGAQEVASTPELTVRTSSLPKALVHRDYRNRLAARGGTPSYHWRIDGGKLPAGIKLLRDGTLQGTPTESGEFRFTVTVSDSGSPPNERSQELVLKVVIPLMAEWHPYPKVNGQRVEGAVKVSNQTDHDFDLTFVVLAVNEIGRATAIGYQHFKLARNAMDFDLPFGETLPYGSYEVHADVVAEVAETDSIYRSHLATKEKLQIVQGP